MLAMTTNAIEVAGVVSENTSKSVFEKPWISSWNVCVRKLRLHRFN